jgi:hypothetical protein
MSRTWLHQWLKGGRAARRGADTPRSAARPRPSVLPRLEQLEDRLAPSATQNAVAVYAPGSLGDNHNWYISSYTGVGFQNNVVGVVQGYTNGQLDTNPNDYTAEINYGDGNGWQQGVVATEQTANGPLVVVKGSDVYGPSQVGLHPIEVQVNFGGTSSNQAQTAWAAATYLPNGQSGTQPPPANPPSATGATENAIFGVSAPGTLGDTHSSSLTTYAGVGLQNSVVGLVQGYVNGVQDTNASDFQAWVNWGDGSGWTQAQLVPSQGSSPTPFLVEGSHVYTQTGTFQVAVYVVGPDGSSQSNGTAQVTVTTNPSPSAPFVSSQPTSQTVTAGQTATFAATAGGTPASSVQWQVSTDGGQNWSNISGATSNVLTLSNVTTSMNGYKYQAVFTNTNGTATTSAATLTVTSLALSPGSGGLPAGTVGTPYNLTITASGGSGNLSVADTIVSGSLPTGLSLTKNNGTLTISGTPTGTGSVTIQVIASDSAGDPTLTQTYVLAVNPSAVPSTPAAPSTPSTAPAFNATLVAQDATLVLQGLQTNNPTLLTEGEQNLLSLMAALPTSAQELAFQAFLVDFFNGLL